MKYRVTITSKPANAPVGCNIILKKEPENQYDNEAISVLVAGDSQGYVSAFYKTRKPGTISAGRLFDKFGESIEGTVVAEGIAEVEVSD